MLVTQAMAAKLPDHFGTSSALPLAPQSVTARALTDFLGERKRGRLTAEADRPLFLPFEVAIRRNGRLLYSHWLEGQSPYRAIHDILTVEPSADLVQLVIATKTRPLTASTWLSELNNTKSGRFGLELSWHGNPVRVSPLTTIASNRPLRRWFESWLDEHSLAPERFFSMGGRMALLECRQFLIPSQGDEAAVETYRGSDLVEIERPTAELAEQLIGGMSRWFMANQDEDGSLPYKYWPSSGTYSEADNPIRRLMASVVLNRLAHHEGRQDIADAAHRNLQFNMKRFYTQIGGHGAILWDGSVKLGAIAIACQAIIESPFSDEWKAELAALRATIDRLWQPTGAFRTFLVPEDRNDNQNFYPGETLVFWATSLAQKPDSDLLARALKSTFFYREHFRTKPNPAFVPWHSQAATILFGITGDVALRDYVFEMNDWLLPHQQWGGKLARDHWGRFYSPDKPEYGPPHASSTGVFLEGLADALKLARGAGDVARARSYQTAIERGIVSLAQLQFRSPGEAFYLQHPRRVLGAIRTEAYNNEIRIDNMQHALAALLKFKALDSGI